MKTVLLVVVEYTINIFNSFSTRLYLDMGKGMQDVDLCLSERNWIESVYVNAHARVCVRERERERERVYMCDKAN